MRRAFQACGCACASRGRPALLPGLVARTPGGRLDGLSFGRRTAHGPHSLFVSEAQMSMNSSTDNGRADERSGAGKRVLIADDQPHVAHAIRLLLKTAGYEATAVSSLSEAMTALSLRHFDLVFLDLNYTADTTSGREGLDVLPELRRRHPGTPVIVMTAWSSVPSAVEAVRAGAVDYLEKPWDNVKLLVLAEIHTRRTPRLRQGVADDQQGSAAPPAILGDSARIRSVLSLIERVAPSDATVLITGEHGTGKELVARWIHAKSPRHQKRFVAINMGGLAEGVSESELFGHIKGAFTDARSDREGRFEAANGGTIFLDEITNAPLALQAKLLRVLQTGEVERVGTTVPRQLDVRVVAATNVDPKAAVAAHRFREDLLFRLNTIEVRLPPLRERREDIPVLAQFFLAQYCARYDRTIRGLSPGVQSLFMSYAWPGNIRELEHTLERAVLLTDGPHITEDAVALVPETMTQADDMTLDDLERRAVISALARAQGNVAQAARALGLNRSALYRRIEAFGL